MTMDKTKTFTMNTFTLHAPVLRGAQLVLRQILRRVLHVRPSRVTSGKGTRALDVGSELADDDGQDKDLHDEHTSTPNTKGKRLEQHARIGRPTWGAACMCWACIVGYRKRPPSVELIQPHMAQKPVLRGEVGCACVATPLCMCIFPYQSFEATPPGAAPGPPVLTESFLMAAVVWLSICLSVVTKSTVYIRWITVSKNGANGAAMRTDENDQDGRFFYNHPERGGYFAA